MLCSGERKERTLFSKSPERNPRVVKIGSSVDPGPRMGSKLLTPGLRRRVGAPGAGARGWSVVEFPERADGHGA